MQSGERRRVVVTGIGLITPLGASVQKTWDGLLAGKSGIGPITRFDATGLETTIAGEVRDFDPLVYMDRKEIRRADRFAQFAVAAAGQALQDAKLQITPDLAPRIGAAFGSGIGGVETLVDNILSHASDPRKVSPFMIPMMIIDMAAGEIAMKYGAKGPNMGHVSACASSANSIGEAAEMIRRGEADAMLAGGAEAGLIKVAIASANAMTGPPLGAAGAIEAAICILAMRDGCLPPTINQEVPDPECDLDYIPNRSRPAEVRVALSNSMGFGGHNVALVLRRDVA